jgi:hypothetical protein
VTEHIPVALSDTSRSTFYERGMVLEQWIWQLCKDADLIWSDIDMDIVSQHTGVDSGELLQPKVAQDEGKVSTYWNNSTPSLTY